MVEEDGSGRLEQKAERHFHPQAGSSENKLEGGCGCQSLSPLPPVTCFLQHGSTS